MSAPGRWTASSLLNFATKTPGALARLGLRTKSPLVADALALTATRHKYTSESLREALMGGAVSVEPFASGARAPTEQLAALAMVWAGTAPTHQHLEAAAALYSELLDLDSFTGLGPIDHQCAGQSLFLAGRYARCREMLGRMERMPAVIRQYLEVDLTHPAVTLGPLEGSTERHDPSQRWQSLLSATFVDAGLTAPEVRQTHPTDHLFDALTCPTSAPAGSAIGPLVTVIIPCFQPDEGLITSVRSITGQTYGDLEIALVDDASGSAYDDLIRHAASLDDRITLHRMTANGGSYLARRAAITRTHGEFITTQDADDWSHPERIERQVDALLTQPDSPASLSQAVRAKDDLTHQWFGYPATRTNASSLMFRRSAQDAVGTFLPLRKGADSEYAERLTTFLGPIADTGLPLAITRLRSGSLSRGDFTLSWSHPDRIAFRGAYRAWHRHIKAEEGEWPQTGRNPDLPPIPPDFVRDLPVHGPTTRVRALQHCLVADFSPAPDTLREGRPDPRRWIDRHPAGQPVGLWHLENPCAHASTRPEMHAQWIDQIIGNPDLVPVTRTQPYVMERILVLHPEVLLVATEQSCSVSLRPDVAALGSGVDVYLSASALASGPFESALDLFAVSDACDQWWGVRPRWVVEDEAALAEISTALPGLAVSIARP